MSEGIETAKFIVWSRRGSKGYDPHPAETFGEALVIREQYDRSGDDPVITERVPLLTIDARSAPQHKTGRRGSLLTDLAVKLLSAGGPMSVPQLTTAILALDPPISRIAPQAVVRNVLKRRTDLFERVGYGYRARAL